MKTTLKDIYLAAHAAALAAHSALPAVTGIDLLDAARDAFRAADFHKLDWGSFYAHFDETGKKLAALAQNYPPSVVEANKEAQRIATAAKLDALKQSRTVPPAAPATSVAATTVSEALPETSPAPAPEVEPK